MKQSIDAFAPGQRWISETQAELGLGLVEGLEHRRVRMRFPATGEQRVYAVHDAPLWRAVFGVGDRIRDQQGRELMVTATESDGPLIAYLGECTDGSPCRVGEWELDAHLRLNRPQQKLLNGRVESATWLDLRLKTWRRRTQAATSPVRGLLGPRISPIPHQLSIAAEVAERHAPRVLLADEVGLGKTIEAGLILHRMLLAGRVSRVLILVPEALLHQWLVELLRRFNLRFALFDEERIASAAPSGDQDNPFQGEQRVLCTLNLLTSDPAIARAALAGEWDLLIVDEAHHLHWTPEESSLEYDLVAALAEETPAVLLLTATPEQLGRAGHFGRLRLLDPRRFADYQSFLVEESDYAPVAELAGRLLDGEPLTQDQQSLLNSMLGDTSGLSPDQVIARLIDRHGTGRVLFRNTRAAIPGFPTRRVHPAPLETPPGYPAATDPAVEPLAGYWPEQIHGPGWDGIDPRVPWLIETLRRLRPAKVLVIAAKATTVLDLRRALLEQAGIHAAVFHEGMEIVERDRAAAYFAAAEEGTQLLVCSEIGSEGRNFQFAHHLVLLDLPLDPELLEQRIGRLDRIGQTQDIEIHCPYLAGTHSESLYRWYAEGLDALSATCPAAAAVNERLGGRLLALISDPNSGSDQMDALIGEAAEVRERLNTELASGRDRLLELGSQRPTEAAELAESIRHEDRDKALFEYLSAFWDAFGVEHEPGPGGTRVLRPGAHMLQEHFPGLPEDGLTACFDRAHALAHEDHAFLTWEHPMVRAAMELISTGDLGTSVILLTRDPRFASGTLLLEAIHVAECPAPPELQAGRFLPATAPRILVDQDGQNRGDAIDPDAIRGKCLSGNRKLARALITAKSAQIESMIAAIAPLAEQASQALRETAIQRMTELLDPEIERIASLAQVNPAVRPDEIEEPRLERERLREALGHIRLRLDALRLIVFA